MGSAQLEEHRWIAELRCSWHVARGYCMPCDLKPAPAAVLPLRTLRQQRHASTPACQRAMHSGWGWQASLVACTSFQVKLGVPA